MDASGSGGRVVVGVDGSDGSRAALRFAFDDARRRGTGLLVVAAFESPELWSISYELPVSSSIDDVRGHVLERTRHVVAETLGPAATEPDGERRGDPAVEIVARPGGAAQVLVCAAAGGVLLVVGSRGLGGFRRLLLGSVSTQCVQHAPCPVTVVPSAPAGDAAPTRDTGAPAALR